MTHGGHHGGGHAHAQDKPRVVKLGDVSTWAIKPHVDGAASGAKPKEPAPLPPAQPRVFGPRKAWPESKLTVKYPHGYCPITKTLAPGKAGADDKDLEVKKKRAERFGLALPKEEAAPSTEAQEVLSAVEKELEAKRRRAEKFGLVQPAAAAPPVDPNDPLAQYTAEFLAKKAEQDRLRAQIQALRKIKAPDAEEEEQPGKKKQRPVSAGAGGRGAGGRGGRGGRGAAAAGRGTKKFIRQ